MRRTLLSLALVLSLARSATADTQANLQAVVSGVVEKGVAGAALCVDDPVQGHYAVAAGVADMATSRQLQPTDRFRIASVSKTFTAAAILLLRDEGRLDLDATLQSYLPEHEIPNADLITLRMLLTHTSGLPDHNNDSTELGQLIASHPEGTITSSQVFSLVRRLPAHFSPGAAWSYCDTGFYILRLVVEKRNEQGWSFAQFVQNRLLTPWALTNTFVPGPENDYLYQIPGVHAHGYMDYAPGDPPIDVTDINQSWDTGCGGMVSTVEDLTRWVRALYSGQVLSARSTAEMRTITMQSRAYGTRYGMATGYDTTVGFGHGGVTSGFLTEMQYDPVHRMASALFVNTMSPATAGHTKQHLVEAKRALGYPEQADPGYARLSAGAGRGLVGTGEQTLMLGFFFGGTEAKPIIVRAAGPSLRSVGVASAIVDPRLQITGLGVPIATNDNWDGSAETTAAFEKVGMLPFPLGGKDAAIVQTLAPGGTCASVASVDGSSGVALLEAYDTRVLASAPGRMRGIAVRGHAGAGEEVLIAGFAVAGNAPLRVLIRGLGPALAGGGIVNPAADPQIALHSGQVIIAQNDDWDGSADTAALIAQTGLSTLQAGSKDAVIIATLNPGAYTVVLNEVAAVAGRVGMIEVYDVQPQRDYTALRQQVGDYVRKRMRETGVVGLSVALVESDGVILQDGFGYSDAAKTIPVTADTQFSIGSVTKTMAAISIMQLVAEGKLDLDSPLSGILPTFAVQQRFTGAPITLRSMLAHHSGLPGDLLNGSMTTVPRERWCDSLLASLAHEYAGRPVGEMMAYSNSAYTLLQNVIEKASGLSLEENSRQFLFGPMGMETSTYGHDSTGWTTGFVAGQAMPTEYVNVGTAGAVKSTARDMARYVRMLLHEGIGERGRVLAPSLFRQMLLEQYPDDAFAESSNIIWGLGFHLGRSDFDYAGSNYSHSGATQIFRSQLTVLKDQGLGIFVVSNSAAPSDLPEEVSREILRIALLQLRGLAAPGPLQAPAPAIISKTRAELDPYAGIYAPGFGGYDKIVATDRGLEWTRAAGTAAPTSCLLLPCADGRFVPDSGGPFQFEFKTIAHRSVMIMHSTNDSWTDRSICGEKLSLSPLSSAWQQRVGDYVWVNLLPFSYAPLILGKDGAEKVKLEMRDGMLLLGGDLIVPTSDTLAFTAGIGSTLGRGRDDAVQIETSGGIETLWFRGQAARLASLPVSSYTYPVQESFRNLSWTEAFEAAHIKFSREYSFGDWKAIDWLGLYNRFAPRIAQAQASGDKKAYYLALHEYVCSIPDGHTSLGTENDAELLALAKEMAGGGFGMAVAELDDGRVIAAAVIANSTAALAGIVAGDEIITWGGSPVKTVIGQIDVGAIPYKKLTGAEGGECPQATLEYRRLEQTRLLSRAPIGTNAQIMFRSAASGDTHTVTLTAEDDAGQTFSLLNFAKRPEMTDRIDHRVLPEGYGYILVRMEHDMSSEGGYPIRIFQEFQAAMTSLIAAGVPGIILDLRGNYGGSDQLSADISGFFFSASDFYESQAYYDKRNGRFLSLTVAERGPTLIVDSLTIEPQTPHFGGPIVVLVNPATISSGEGPAMAISRLPQGRVIGFHGTNGSFGMTGGKITMPEGYSIQYTYGRTLDRNGVTQIDSRNGVGGVSPNPRVPKTLENVLAFAAGTDVELQYAIEYLRTH